MSKISKRESQKVDLLPVDLLEISPYNVRDNPEINIDDLIKSVREIGILQPLIVRPLKTPDGKPTGKYEVIVGARRLMAARAVGLKTVPCIIRDVPDSEAIIMSLTENIQRGNISEEEIRKALLRLYQDFKMRPADIATRLGVSIDYIHKFIKLAKTLEEIKAKAIKKPGRWRQEITPEKESIVPITIATTAEKIITAVKRTEVKIDEEELRKKVLEKTKNLKQKQVQRVVQEIRKELPIVTKTIKEPEKLEEYNEKRIEEIKEKIKRTKQVTILIPEDLLFNVRSIAKKLDIDDDDVIIAALEFSLSKNEFLEYLKSYKLHS